MPRRRNDPEPFPEPTAEVPAPTAARAEPVSRRTTPTLAYDATGAVVAEIAPGTGIVLEDGWTLGD